MANNGNLRPFKKGDPHTIACGKKSKRKSYDAELREKLESGLFNSLVEVLESKGKEGDLKAIEIIFDRAYGKAKQHINLGNAEEGGLKINIIKNYESDKPNE